MISRRWCAPRSLLLALVLSSALGCKEPSEDVPEAAETSPNARIVPAPLLSGKSLVAKLSPSVAPTRAASVAVSAGPRASEPYSLRAPAGFDNDVERSAGGVFLNGEFTWPGRQRKPTFHGLDPELAAIATDAVRRKVAINLSSYDRISLQLESDAFPLERDSVLLARRDREGHLLLWPDQRRFRVVPAGAVRALFREGRLDVTPPMAPVIQPQSDGTRFDGTTHSVQLETVHGRLLLQQLEMPELGFGGGLLCRFLLELIAASAPSEVCRDDAVPTRAEYEFESEARLTFDVRELEYLGEAPTEEVRVPPSRAQFVARDLPLARPIIFSPEVHAALRRGDGAKDTTLHAKNPGALGSYLLLDDTPLSYLPPRTSRTLTGFRSGEYSLSALSFFGEPLQASRAVAVPGEVSVGVPIPKLDAGAQ